MSIEGIVAGTITGVVVGVVSAVVTHKALCKVDETSHEEELSNVTHAAYNNGWHDASNHAGNVRNAYVRLFEVADETAGTSTKATKKA
jgi:hypothetical protein